MALTPPSDVVLVALESLLQVPADWIGDRVRAAQEGRYNSWTIPKGDGRVRRISAPADELKELQKVLLESLLYRGPLSPFAHGFIPGRSIVTNARAHLPDPKGLLSLDLENAYPSVSASRVRHSLEWALGYHVKHSLPIIDSKGATYRELFDLLTDICCYKGCLPQGAPTSGMVLNLACAPLDRICTRLVGSWQARLPGLTYTRYADDLTFTAETEISTEFESDVLRSIKPTGFRVNPRKISRHTVSHAAIVICGVRIQDGQIGLPRATLRRYRAMFFQSLAYNPSDTPKEVRDILYGSLGLLRMIYQSCPTVLESSLRVMLNHHASWLSLVPRSKPRIHVRPYGFQ